MSYDTVEKETKKKPDLYYFMVLEMTHEDVLELRNPSCHDLGF